jgi:predicted O-linked N-acetylglucosamine transferase (SPINDLY family)
VNFNCPGTTGADYFDYIVTDRTVVPPEHHRYYTEKVAYLPDTFQAFDSQRRIAERAPSRGEAGLPERGFVFCSFNNSYKFRPRVFDIWMRLLRRFEGSVLWLRGGSPTMMDNLRGEATVRGVDPGRLVFAPYIKRMEDHLARQRLADLFLDTLPYNAQTTAGDALWAGLPVLTCLGGALPGRVAASLLTAVGLPELVTRSLEEYEALAIALAREPERLRRIRDKLARNRLTCPLFDTARFTRHLEAAYEEMVRLHHQGESPRHFSVAPLAGQAAHAADDR